MSEYKLVPVEPTDEMIEAARSARPYIDDDEDEFKDRNSEMTWGAMVAAATTQEVEPSIGLLTSMAIRYDHGLGCAGYYDALFGPGEHKKRFDAAIRTMRQLYEEVSGQGFYKPERESDYAAIAAENSQ